MPERIGSPPDSAPDTDPIASSIDDRLRKLEAESARRSAELRELAAAVPEAMSRRAVFAAMIADLRRAPDKWTVVRRVAAKVGRLPAELFREVTRP